ncbi:hypothetical protein, partial [Nostoc sp. ChiSLP03a]|uniref:hypothetical protein n=1 Tax=Nostoc sp. ChiSLP03a TaxID=3075380 RepID=UPI002AD4AE32
EDTVCRRFFSSSSLSAIAILNGRLMVLLTYLVCFSPLYADSFLIGIRKLVFHDTIIGYLKLIVVIVHTPN